MVSWRDPIEFNFSEYKLLSEEGKLVFFPSYLEHYVQENKSNLFEILSKKPLVPNKKEISQNVRSRSAKLRYGIRNNNSFFFPKEFILIFRFCPFG